MFSHLHSLSIHVYACCTYTDARKCPVKLFLNGLPFYSWMGPWERSFCIESQASFIVFLSTVRSLVNVEAGYGSPGPGGVLPENLGRGVRPAP